METDVIETRTEDARSNHGNVSRRSQHLGTQERPTLELQVAACAYSYQPFQKTPILHIVFTGHQLLRLSYIDRHGASDRLNRQLSAVACLVWHGAGGGLRGSQVMHHPRMANLHAAIAFLG